MEPEKQTRPGEPTSGAENPRSRTRPWVVALEIVFAVVFLLLVAAVVLPNFIRVSDGLEAEVKNNLHNIQLAVERYAVDRGGQYPPLLIGGEGKYAEMVKVEDGREVYTEPRNCPFPTQLTDPLVREGYMPFYPKNPFVRRIGVHSWQMEYSDPLRNGTEEGKLHGTRFGAYSSRSGNVMADKRYATFTLPGATEPTRTYTDIEYPCADLWPRGAKEPKPFLPGMFFYRSQSFPVLVNGEGAEPEMRELVQGYILGAYGGLRTKGKDVIGPDATDRNTFSPFGGGTGDEAVFGNPNGIRDGIILVLTPQEDVPATEPLGL